MFEHRAVLDRYAGLTVRLVLIRREHRRVQKRHPLVEDPGVSGGAHVFGHHERQPQQIVGAARTQAASARLVPPVLHVALDELPPGGAQQMRPGEVWPRQQDRHHVLELIAEADAPPGW